MSRYTLTGLWVTCRPCPSDSSPCPAASASGSLKTPPAVSPPPPHCSVYSVSTACAARRAEAPSSPMFFVPVARELALERGTQLDFWLLSASGSGCPGRLLCTGTSSCFLCHFSFSLSLLRCVCPMNMYAHCNPGRPLAHAFCEVIQSKFQNNIENKTYAPHNKDHSIFVHVVLCRMRQT